MSAPRSDRPVSASVERLRQEFDRWLEAAWSQGERAMDAIGIRGQRPWTPPVDVIEDNDTVRVLFNLPGVAAEEIELTLMGHMLTVCGAFPSDDLGVGGERLLAERPSGEFKRTIPLPASVNPETIAAASRHGVLTITVTKTEQQKARKIVVQSAPASGAPGCGT